ncbi:hypothetical protein [Flavobacterium lindanitolerans]|uniref:Uncharacterized protein n=1 Tax=Flavobacterium lindanitolerans TaxID=428988 RepID=A0A497TZ47_9FLAO|nr:hypothetical protein [Flavobacterium lindanitolerans]PKW20053.1 hypothetical protein B0G92_3293 [Flavobacterium lindanitolerans]RLJ23152.1 hypothetical protein CLV50_3302 [Flavobacterium lindanitolerans]
MKWIKNITVFFIFLVSLFFSQTEEAKAFGAISIPQNKKSIEQVDFLKASAFINQEISINSISNPRADLPTYAKWFEFYYDVSFSGFSTCKATAAFLKQDINRCLNVSILLFPFHFFW